AKFGGRSTGNVRAGKGESCEPYVALGESGRTRSLPSRRARPRDFALYFTVALPSLRSPLKSMVLSTSTVGNHGDTRTSSTYCARASACERFERSQKALSPECFSSPLSAPEPSASSVT